MVERLRFRRVTRGRIHAALGVLVISVTLPACGGSSGNGVAGKSVGGITQAMTQALAHVTSAHISGTIAAGASQTGLDLKLVSGKGGRGTISQGPLSFRVVVVGGQVYIYGGKVFLSRFGGSSAVKLFSGKWLQEPATGQYALFASLTNLQSLFHQLLSHKDRITKGSQTKVEGQQAIELIDKSRGGTLYVATTGKPLPIAIVKTGTSGGRIDFSGYDQPVTLTAPKGAINLSGLG